MKNFSNILIGIVVLVVIALIVFVAMRGNEGRAEDKLALDNFAQCIADSGATFYGAFWCPHCQDQKTAFKNSKNLPYVECSTPGREQTEECIDAGIESYPTWEFADGERRTGNLSLATLAEETGCEIPAL